MWDFIKENPNINKIMLCLDNDEAGHFACNQIFNKYKDRYEIVRHKPKGKDFNEDLIALIKESKVTKISENDDIYGSGDYSNEFDDMSI